MVKQQSSPRQEALAAHGTVMVQGGYIGTSQWLYQHSGGLGSLLTSHWVIPCQIIRLKSKC